MFLNLVLLPCYDRNVKDIKVASIDVEYEDPIANLVDYYDTKKLIGADWDQNEFRTYIPKTTLRKPNNIIYSPYVGERDKITTGYYSDSPYGDPISEHKCRDGISVDISKYGVLYYSTIIEEKAYSWQILLKIGGYEEKIL